MRINSKSAISLITLFSLLNSCLLFGQDLETVSGLGTSKETVSGKGSEYVSGDYPGASLMKVNLWGAVGKPGIHFIPHQTDLITLLSYAGGPTESAKLGGIYIKRWEAGRESVLKIDAEDILKGTETKAPMLKANDIIVVPKSQPILSQDTMTVVAFVTSLLSIAAVGIVVFKR